MTVLARIVAQADLPLSPLVHSILCYVIPGPADPVEVVRHDPVVSNDPEDEPGGAQGSWARGKG